MRKALFIVGTRPEAIKLYPVIKRFKEDSSWKTIVLTTGQHKELLDDIVEDLKISVDIKLLTSDNAIVIFPFLYEQLDVVMEARKPSIVIVQGDTVSAYIGALVAFMYGVPVAHVEAGLRSNDLTQPFPEEGLRQMISRIATYNFAPTELAASRLLDEGALGDIFVTGNTAIDTIKEKYEKHKLSPKRKQLLVTIHRRENWGEPIENVARAVKRFLDETGWGLVWPAHPNPKVKNTIEKVLGWSMPAMKYTDFVEEMAQSGVILTDSGGIQEEASVLHTPVLVARNVTERPECVTMGYAKLVGTDEENVYRELMKAKKRKVSKDVYNLFGKGNAAIKIHKYLCQKMK